MPIPNVTGQADPEEKFSIQSFKVAASVCALIAACKTCTY